MEILRALKLQMEIQNQVSKERIKHEVQKIHFLSENSITSGSSNYELLPIQLPIFTGKSISCKK